MSERAGWLYKQSGGKSKRGNSVGNLVAKWDRRYFVLTGCMLRYYKSVHDATSGAIAAGSIDCRSCTVAEVGRECTFSIATRDRLLTLRADERETRGQWMEALLVASRVSTPGNSPNRRRALSRLV